MKSIIGKKGKVKDKERKEKRASSHKKKSACVPKFDPLPLDLLLESSKEDNPLAHAPTFRSVDIQPLSTQKIGPYLLQKVLGVGAYGEVYLATDSRHNNRKVAVKKMEKQPNIYAEVVRETDIIFSLKAHPFCVRFIDKIETNEHVFLVMQFANGGDLYEYVFPEVDESQEQDSLPRYVKEEESLELFCKIILGLEHMHECGIVHNDLKLENIFLSAEKQPLIGDFGLARRFDPEHRQYYSQGTLHYCAPESILEINVYGPEIDVWAMGIMLYIMLYGRYPFYGPTQVDILKSIAYGNLNLNITQGKMLSPKTKDLVSCMLKKNPTRRITIPRIKKHPAVSHIFKRLSKWMDEHPIPDEEMEPFTKYERYLTQLEKPSITIPAKQEQTESSDDDDKVPKLPLTSLLADVDEARVQKTARESVTARNCALPSHRSEKADLPSLLHSPVKPTEKLATKIPSGSGSVFLKEALQRAARTISREQYDEDDQIRREESSEEDGDSYEELME